MKIIALLASLVIAVIVGAALFIWSGAYNVAADEPHWGLTSRVLAVVRERSVANRASRLETPDLERADAIRVGTGNYEAMCAGCHLRPGLESTDLSAGLNPAPPALARASHMKPAESFWVIKHGIRMTGMPAWRTHMDDESIWGIVAFMQKLPALTPEAYRQLVKSSGGHSHGHGKASEEPTAEPATHVHDDGRSHVH